MGQNNAFTAGVKPGGLTDSTQIKLLLCYLIKNAGPISRQEMETALMQEELVNYFEMISCLEDVLRQGLILCENDLYSITEKGRKVTTELSQDLPRRVRECAVTAAIQAQTWSRKTAEYNVKLTEQPDGHYDVKCTINGLEEAAFCLHLTMPDRATAELVKRRFILRGNEIYQLLINKLTEEE